MSDPTQNEKKSETKQVRMVKVRALQPISIGPKGTGKILEPGQEAEVTEEMAAEYCDRKLRTFYDWSGERGREKPTTMTRAVRV